MGKSGVKIAVFGIACNFILFIIKLYVGISSNSLSIYCDSINNLGDTVSCMIALLGFILVVKTNEIKGSKIQALCSFVIGLIVAATGAYCVYSGLERFMYPLLVSYSVKYAVLICITAVIKLIMGRIYILIHKKTPSPVLRSLILDSYLDFGVTLMAILGFYLVERVHFAVDGLTGMIIGTIILITAVKAVFQQAKFLVNH